MRREALNVGERAGAGQSSGESGGQGFDGFAEAVARQPGHPGVIAQAQHVLQQGVDVGGDATAGMVAARGLSRSEEVRQVTIERRRLDVRLATAPRGRVWSTPARSGSIDPPRPRAGPASYRVDAVGKPLTEPIVHVARCPRSVFQCFIADERVSPFIGYQLDNGRPAVHRRAVQAVGLAPVRAERHVRPLGSVAATVPPLPKLRESSGPRRPGRRPWRCCGRDDHASDGSGFERERPPIVTVSADMEILHQGRTRTVAGVAAARHQDDQDGHQKHSHHRPT